MTTQMRHCVRAAQQGDKLAIEELLQTFKRFFRHQADEFKDYYPNREEALSTAHQAAIDCILHFDWQQTEIGLPKKMFSFVRNYLSREAYRQQRDRRKIQKNIVEKDKVTDLPESLLASENDDPEQHYFKEEIRRKTWRAIGRLPKQHRKIICLRYFHGYSYQDIAAECKMSKSSARNYVNSGTEKLKIYLMEEGLAG